MGCVLVFSRSGAGETQLFPFRIMASANSGFRPFTLFFAPFAERPEARVRREAKARQICSVCPVADLCKEYARDNRELGFWGGESESERATAGFAPTTPIIGRRQVAAQRAAAALARWLA